MTGSRLVVWFLRGTLIASAVTWALVGCSRQSEGERCDYLAAGDTDCNDGLKCVVCAELDDHVTDRCCPPQSGAETDGRCRRSATPHPELCQTVSNTGGSGGRAGSGTGGRSGSGGTNSSGGMSGEAGIGGGQ